jgi:hypothetical protein
MPGPSKKSRRLSSANGALGRHERHDSGDEARNKQRRRNAGRTSCRVLGDRQARRLGAAPMPDVRRAQRPQTGQQFRTIETLVLIFLLRPPPEGLALAHEA